MCTINFFCVSLTLTNLCHNKQIVRVRNIVSIDLYVDRYEDCIDWDDDCEVFQCFSRSVVTRQSTRGDGALLLLAM